MRAVVDGFELLKDNEALVTLKMPLQAAQALPMGTVVEVSGGVPLLKHMPDELHDVCARVPSLEDPWYYFIQRQHWPEDLTDPQDPRIPALATRREFWWEAGNNYVFSWREQPGGEWSTYEEGEFEPPERPSWVDDLLRNHITDEVREKWAERAGT